MDRNTLTIQYNLLNLPQVILFHNGNQIRNLYDAGGQKLRSDYYTRLSSATAPITANEPVYSTTDYSYSGTAYIGNKEYQIIKYASSGTYAEMRPIKRIHNSEGYAENSIFFPNYYYFRRDHLGNNREVWLANTDSTVQRTQYYPSGLPWKTNTDDNPDAQPYKYNGKEFIEMHGWDTYDYGARGYYAAIGRWTSVDPLAEKYYSVSPYAYCNNNPVNKIDPDGKWVWSLISAGIDYGLQVHDNYQKGYTGGDAWFGKVDFVSVGLSAIPGGGLLKTAAVETLKATISVTPSDGLKINTDIKDVATQVVVNTAVSKLGEGVANKIETASSETAVRSANKEVASANQRLSTAERQASRRPNSTIKAENVNAAKSNLQVARNNQVTTQILNSTVGNVNKNVMQETITTTAKREIWQLYDDKNK